MRLINLAGRLSLAPDGLDGRAIDVETASGGRFVADVQSVYARWDEFRGWARELDARGDREITPEALGPPVPRPPQVFAIGVNYRDHAAEAGIELPETPMVFTKFPACVAGPHGEIELPSDTVDFEVELVAVVGRHARRVDRADAWSVIAGLTAGQDLSDRGVQLGGPRPQQFNIGKSFAGFAPIGPALVTPDELADPDDLELGCSLSGETMQQGRTRDFVFGLPELVTYLSSVLPLLPGDLIFTGTPAGIGWARDPRRTITPDDELVTHVGGIGEMRHRFVART